LYNINLIYLLYKKTEKYKDFVTVGQPAQKEPKAVQTVTPSQAVQARVTVVTKRPEKSP
jgi:hypothetical protein